MRLRCMRFATRCVGLYGMFVSFRWLRPAARFVFLFGWLGWLRDCYWGSRWSRAVSLSEERRVHVAKLESVAERAERESRRVEERLAFERRRREALSRARTAKSQQRRVRRLLREYGVRDIAWRSLLVGGLFTLLGIMLVMFVLAVWLGW